VSRFHNRFDVREGDTHLEYRKDPAKGIAWLTLNRPEKLNAMTVPMRERMREFVLDDVDTDDDIKVLVIRGEGRAFSSGHELNEEWGQRLPGQKRRALTDGARYGDDICSGRGSYGQTIARCSKPVVAGIHGYTYAGAYYMLTLHCDIIVAADDTRFGAPQIRFLGATGPNEVKQIRALGLKAARWIAFTGVPLSGERARQLGWVHLCVPNDELIATTDRIAAELAQRPLNELLLLKARFKSVETVMGGMIGADMMDLTPNSFQAAPDEPQFWRNATTHGLKAALAEGWQRSGIDPRMESPAGKE
jgi:enoyl-CoA hydratase/carnithine racemase